MSGHEWGTVYFDDVAYPAYRDANYNELAVFSRKVVQGDYTRDSDELISSKIWTTFQGGIGIENNREGANEGRVWFSTLFGQRPFQLTLNRLVVEVADMKYPLGDLADTFYAANADKEVKAWNETTDVMGTVVDTLDHVPVHRATAFNGKLFIPCGSSGYEHFDGATLSGAIASPQALDFIDWDNRLWAMGDDGALMSSDTGLTGTWTTEAQLNTSLQPRRMEIWMDRAENETLVIVTDRRIFMFDPVNGLFIPTRLSFPPHPDNGLGLAVWHPGEDLYITAGTQVYRYGAGFSLIEPNTGPSRDEGLPDELRGRIVDLIPEHNALIGLLEGVSTSSMAEPTAEFDEGSNSDDPLNLSSTDAVSALLAYNGFGWHSYWRSASAAGSPTWCYVSASAGAYRLWWGFDDSLLTIALPRNSSNPLQQWRTGEGMYEPSGSMDLGWYDAGMPEFDKLASHVEVKMTNATTDEAMLIEYRLDHDSSDNDTVWTTLGEVTATGPNILPLGVQTLADGTTFGQGVVFRRLRFRLTMRRGSDPTQTPVMDFMTLKFIKLPISGAAYTISIPLQFGHEGWGDRTMEQIKAEFQALVTKQGFVRMQLQEGESVRVRLSQVTGTDRIADDDRGDRMIRVVRIPLDGFEGTA